MMRRTIAVALSLGLWGCTAGSLEPVPDGADLEPTLLSIQEHVLTPACATSGCHTSVTVAGGLDLSTAESSWDGMVGMVPTNSVAIDNDWMRVAPGEPDTSFLVRKLRGPGAGEGARMPLNRSLDEESVAVIEQWIEDGAPP